MEQVKKVFHLMSECSHGAAGSVLVLASALYARGESIVLAAGSAERQSDAEGHLKDWGKPELQDNPAATGAL